MDLRTRLETRGFLNQWTDDALFELYNNGKQTLYVGFDPTADSLHLGNFVQFMHALQYMLYGNKAILVIGGATGMIGDPGGKESERSFLNQETLERNVASITKQVGQLIAGIETSTGKKLDYEVINNLTFYKDFSYIDFLREVGKHITVNQMMNKETVKHRLTQDGKFISYTEFSYMLMQGYDYVQLYKNNNCRLQISGSDQRGNIVTGIELIRKKLQQEAYGATCPLITDSTGRKFGKSEGNAIRLDANKNSPYVCYNYFMNSGDEDIKKYLNIFTLLDQEEIHTIIQKHQKDQQIRYGQQRLAYEATAIIYGKEAAQQSQKIKETLFDATDIMDTIANMTQQDTIALNKATSGYTVNTHEGRLLELLVETGLYGSNSEAKKAIKAHAVSLNENKIHDIGYVLTENDYINGIALLRKGKKRYASVLLTK